MKASKWTAVCIVSFMYLGCGSIGEMDQSAIENEDRMPDTNHEKHPISMSQQLHESGFVVYEGLDPYDTGCDRASRIVADTSLTVDASHTGYVELWWSCVCNAYWTVSQVTGGPLSDIMARVLDSRRTGSGYRTWASSAWNVHSTMMGDTGSMIGRGTFYATDGWIKLASTVAVVSPPSSCR